MKNFVSFIFISMQKTLYYILTTLEYSQCVLYLCANIHNKNILCIYTCLFDFYFSHSNVCYLSHIICVCARESGSGRFFYYYFCFLVVGGIAKKTEWEHPFLHQNRKWDILLLLFVCVWKSLKPYISYLWLCRPTNNTTNAALNKIMGRNEHWTSKRFGIKSVNMCCVFSV